MKRTGGNKLQGKRKEENTGLGSVDKFVNSSGPCSHSLRQRRERPRSSLYREIGVCRNAGPHRDDGTYGDTNVSADRAGGRRREPA